MATCAKKYNGLDQTLRPVIAEEAARSLYGGFGAHLMRVVPNAAVVFWVYEGILRWGKTRRSWVPRSAFLVFIISPASAMLFWRNAAFARSSLYHTPSTIVSKPPVYLFDT